ncbi:MAG: TIGR03546 family protein [Nitrospiraceae bacterium]
MLKTLVNFIKIMNSEAEPGQISLALGLSMVAGFTPLFSLHNLLVLLLVLLLRVNLSAFLLGLTFFSGLAYALDPLFHRIGLAVLTASPLNGLWTTLYNSTLWRVERFNNSIVMGSLLVSLLFLVPFYFLANWAILRYRDHVLAWVRKTRLMQVLSAVRWGGDL